MAALYPGSLTLWENNRNSIGQLLLAPCIYTGQNLTSCICKQPCCNLLSISQYSDAFTCLVPVFVQLQVVCRLVASCCDKPDMYFFVATSLWDFWLCIWLYGTGGERFEQRPFIEYIYYMTMVTFFLFTLWAMECNLKPDCTLFRFKVAL